MPEQPSVQTAQPQALAGDVPQTGASAPSAAVTIPAATRILMVLTSPLNTTSGTAGSGIYLETLYPLVQGNRVVIPAHSQVQGAVENNRRPGHVQRTAEFKFHFTTLVFPNNHAVSINGVLQSVPGSTTARAQRNHGTLRRVDQTEKVVTPAVAGAVTGAVLGSVTRFGVGKFVGAGLGAGLGLGGALLRRGDEISLPSGTNVEMVLESPLVLDPEQVAFNAQYLPPHQTHVEAQDARSDDNAQENPKKMRSMRTPARLRWPGGLLLPEYDN